MRMNDKTTMKFKFSVKSFVKLYVAAAILMFLGGLLFVPIASHVSQDSITFTVEDKERIINGEESYWLVFTDQGVFKNSDDIWQGKWTSADLQSDLLRGHKYTCDKSYWRVPFLSMYENLNRCTEVK